MQNISKLAVEKMLHFSSIMAQKNFKKLPTGREKKKIKYMGNHSLKKLMFVEKYCKNYQSIMGKNHEICSCIMYLKIVNFIIMLQVQTGKLANLSWNKITKFVNWLEEKICKIHHLVSRKNCKIYQSIVIKIKTFSSQVQKNNDEYCHSLWREGAVKSANWV